MAAARITPYTASYMVVVFDEGGFRPLPITKLFP